MFRGMVLFLAVALWLWTPMVSSFHYSQINTMNRLTSDQLNTLGYSRGFVALAGENWVQVIEVAEENYFSYPLPEVKGDTPFKVNAVLPLGADQFWLGTNSGLFLYRGGSYLQFDKKEGLPHVDVRLLKSLPDGKIAVGLFAGYLGVIDGDQPGGFVPTARSDEFGTLGVLDDIQALAVVDIAPYKGENFLALSSRGIGIINQNGLYRDFEQKEIFKSSWATTVAGNNDYLFVGTSKGLYRISGSTAEPMDIGGESQWITSITVGKLDHLWVGTQKGLIHCDATGRPLENFSAANGTLADDHFQKLDYDPESRSIFAATEKGGLYRFHDEPVPPVETILDREKYVRNQLVVRFSEGATEKKIQTFLEQNYLTKLEKCDELGAYLLDTGDRDAMEVLKMVSKDPLLADSEPNFKFYSLLRPKDPYFAMQENLASMKAEKAWDKFQGNSGIVLAVLDTGVDPQHQDLKSRLTTGANYVEKGEIKDDHGHGTHVAGIAMADSSNGLGVTGVEWKGKIMPVRVLGKSGGDTFTICRGILFAANAGADVINMSLGGAGKSWMMEGAIKYATTRGTTTVAAMGNDNTNYPFYPAAYPGVIAVGAVDNKGDKASFSNFGSHMTISAPGVRIPSTYIAPMKYAYLSGTSMASPHVAGAVALYLGKQKGQGYKKSASTGSQVAEVLKSTADTTKGGLKVLNLESLMTRGKNLK